MTPTGNYKVLQIHPTRRCNLRCLHCYSSSSPDEREELDAELLLQAITDASKEGYANVSFSGGEPILYQSLLELLDRAHQCQMRTAVVSNGMLLDERHLEKLEEAIDILAISLDGMPASHNRMRGQEQAFETMARRLESLRQSGIPFGFIFTLTKRNFRELDWVANFALEQEAKLLQIHPLEEVGRAQQYLTGVKPNESIRAYAYLQAMRLQKTLGDRLYIQIDLVHQDFLRSNPSSFFANEFLENNAELPFAEIISPLIIEADGTVVPLQHGFSRQYALGNLKNAPLRELSEWWRRKCYFSFLELCKQVYQEVTTPAELPITDWYEAIAYHAESVGKVL
jgi:MoaA/NifB/PqqE/SkfB family radical SAM enzyme